MQGGARGDAHTFRIKLLGLIGAKPACSSMLSGPMSVAPSILSTIPVGKTCRLGRKVRIVGETRDTAGCLSECDAGQHQAGAAESAEHRPLGR